MLSAWTDREGTEGGEERADRQTERRHRQTVRWEAMLKANPTVNKACGIAYV